MLLQPRSLVLTPKPASAPVPLRLPAAGRQVTVQAIRPNNGSNNLEPGASQFEARLQAASRRAKSRLDQAEAQQDALALQLTTWESQRVKIVTISFMAMSLSAAAARVLGSPLPVDVVWAALIWAVYYYWPLSHPWKDVESAWSKANGDLGMAHAEALAELESCRASALEDLAKLMAMSRLPSWLQSLLLKPAAGSRVQSGQVLTGERIAAETKEVQERIERRREMLVSRLGQLRARSNLLPNLWLDTTIILIAAPFPAHIFAWSGSCSEYTPLYLLCYMLVCCLIPWMYRTQYS